MTCEFNVDRFYAQLSAFSIFVISHERGQKVKKRQGMCHLDDTALSSYPAASGCRVLYLSRFFLSFFLFLSQFSAYNSNMPEPILTILGHNPLQYRYMSHDQHGVKGHVGVTGVKRSVFTKNASPTNFKLRSCDLQAYSMLSRVKTGEPSVCLHTKVL